MKPQQEESAANVALRLKFLQAAIEQEVKARNAQYAKNQWYSTTNAEVVELRTAYLNRAGVMYVKNNA